MGNLCTCFAPKTVKKKKSTKRLPGNPQSVPNSSNRWTRIRSTRKDSTDSSIQEQALAAAILFRQHQQQNGSGSLPFDRSASLRYPNNSGSKKTQLPRSSSSRARSLTDPLLQPHQLVNQDIKLDDLETNHLVLVHGGGFGAWCWYKTIALLEEGGFKVTAVDLTGSGIHSFDTNGITSLSQYVKPLTNFLEKLSDGEKVILVGHDFGGACISYAMELFPHKTSKAIFVAAAMLTNGQSTLDMFSQQVPAFVLKNQTTAKEMGRRGVSAGGGQSSLGYLFGNGETANNASAAKTEGQTANNSPSQKPAIASPTIDKQTPAGVHGNLTNNYYRADGQNCGNFITDRPSTKVHAAPGGGSSLGYLFGGNGN
ncbi:hypothetical protein GH714_031428 [Hevea brasiliensis]|uniref:AB hydrolase-1 domain-containing protein n=2 Tax=Hevea brasiliensis TaxID=3981 RepID=A0A6A6LE49_HEVBR|nr:hypothetical protein GH714_031428 [Hevea brasiliensis]